MSASAQARLVQTHFARLLPLFTRERAAERPLVLATLITTQGSTYRKSGAQMLIASDGEYAGLISGGCLEGDLREHAREVSETLTARHVAYDMRNPDDQLFGLGAGCEGAMYILLQPVGPQNEWQPLAQMLSNWQQHQHQPIRLMTEDHAALPLGSVALADGQVITPRGERRQEGNESGWYPLPANLPPRMLILGAGPDAEPLGALAHLLGWKYSLYDHRAAVLNRSRFPDAEHLHHGRAALLETQVTLTDYDAVIVMSHNMDSDLSYLRQLAHVTVPYIGLLGPAARREKLFHELGAQAMGHLREHLHAPVGLPIGAATPEAIALSIIAEIHQVLAGR